MLCALCFSAFACYSNNNNNNSNSTIHNSRKVYTLPVLLYFINVINEPYVVRAAVNSWIVPQPDGRTDPQRDIHHGLPPSIRVMLFPNHLSRHGGNGDSFIFFFFLLSLQDVKGRETRETWGKPKRLSMFLIDAYRTRASFTLATHNDNNNDV